MNCEKQQLSARVISEKMLTERSFIQSSILKFDGHYNHWSMLMENFLRLKEYWTFVEQGVPAATAERVPLTEAQKKAIDDHSLKDLKAKNYLFQAIDRSILETILKKDTARIYGLVKVEVSRHVTSQVCSIANTSKRMEMLHMKVGEYVNEYFARTQTIVNEKRIHGEKMDDIAVIEKILRSMTPKFDYVVCFIEESKD